MTRTRENGSLTVIGLGPGPDHWITPATSSIIQSATDFIGYKPYLDRLPDSTGQTRHSSDNREEISRAEHACALACHGKHVAVVSGGDPGVFAMAAAICEAIDHGPEDWRNIDFRVEPGVTAMLAAAARVGAPLGHDFAVLSLSDILKPWPIIEKRLRLVSEADLAIAIYNPASRTRIDQISRALAILNETRGPKTPVVVAKSVGREKEHIQIQTLSDVDCNAIDMRTLLIVGSSQTRIISRPGKSPLVYTERFIKEA